MNKSSKTYIAGHHGLVGSALMRNLQGKGFSRLVTRTHSELDLTNQAATEAFFAQEQPDYVFLAAARVGGILANNTYPAEFIRDNLVIQTNIIHAAYQSGVERLMFLGSSCIYPKLAPQPMREDCLLTGSLEPTNRPYALAKIAGIEMCWSYNRQYGTQYVSVMPTNLYGPNDNYDLNNSHVLPALMRKAHAAKLRGDASYVVWGSGMPMREFLYVDDMADACVFLTERDDIRDDLFNVGTGQDVTIRELAEIVMDVVGFEVGIVLDASKPDGTPRRLLNMDRIHALGWQARTSLRAGIAMAYVDFMNKAIA